MAKAFYRQKKKKSAVDFGQTTSFRFSDKLNFFLNFCSFTGTSAQVVQLRSSYLTTTNNRYARNFGRVDGIRLFYAYAVGNVAYGESFGNAAVLLCDYDAFEVLDSFLTAFDDFIADLNRVAYFECRNFGFHAFSVDSFDDSFHLDFTSVIYETFITRCVIPHHAQIKGSGTLEVSTYYIRFFMLWQAFLLYFETFFAFYGYFFSFFYINANKYT